MRTGTLIKVVLGIGSLAYSAWQLPDLMDKVQGKGGAAGAPNSAMGLLGALTGAGAAGAGPGAPGSAMGAGGPMLLNLLGGAPQPHPEGAAPLPKADATDFVIYSADGKPLTPEERERALKEAARKAPLKPGANVKVSKGKGSPKAGAAPMADPMAGVDAQALEDITRQLKQELAKQRAP